MNILLAVVLVLQEPTAQETFAKIEQAIEQATSLKIRITYTVELPPKVPGAPGEKRSTTAEILIADQNRVRVTVEPSPWFKGGGDDMSVRSDGTLMRAVNPAGEVSEGKAPATTSAAFKTLLARTGYFGAQDLIPRRTSVRPRNPDLANFLQKDLKKELAMTGLELVKEAESESLKYTVKGQIPVRLWYSPKTHLPLRRTWELPFPVPGNKVIQCTEAYDELTLNAPLADDLFKIQDDVKK